METAKKSYILQETQALKSFLQLGNKPNLKN